MGSYSVSTFHWNPKQLSSYLWDSWGEWRSQSVSISIFAWIQNNSYLLGVSYSVSTSLHIPKQLNKFLFPGWYQGSYSNLHLLLLFKSHSQPQQWHINLSLAPNTTLSPFLLLFKSQSNSITIYGWKFDWIRTTETTSTALKMKNSLVCRSNVAFITLDNNLIHCIHYTGWYILCCIHYVW